MQKYLIVLWVILCLKAQAVDQPADTAKTYHGDYIESYSDLLSLRVYGINKYNKFSVYDKQSGHSLDYSPNGRMNFGLGFNYKWLGLGVAFNFPFINNDNEKYGETRRFDLQANIYTRAFTIDGHLQSYKGYFIDNPEDYLPGWKNAMTYPQRPDVNTLSFGASCIYSFNHDKFLYRASFIQNELQKKSAGSFLAGAFLSYCTLKADSTIVPAVLRDTFDIKNNITGTDVLNIGLVFGYAHTFIIWKHYFVTLSVAPGFSFQDVTINNIQSDENYTGISPKLQTRGGLGYNHCRYYAGITFVNDGFKLNKPYGDRLSYETGNIRFFFGKRFNVSKKQ